MQVVNDLEAAAHGRRMRKQDDRLLRGHVTQHAAEPVALRLVNMHLMVAHLVAAVAGRGDADEDRRPCVDCPVVVLPPCFLPCRQIVLIGIKHRALEIVISCTASCAICLERLREELAEACLRCWFHIMSRSRCGWNVESGSASNV